MRENRFFDITESNVGEILRIKSGSFSGVLSVSPEASIRDALKLMSQNNISQLPVLEKGAAIGSIEEGQLMASLIENQEKVDGAVKEVMGRPFPVLSTTDSVDDAKKLFAQKYPAILVAQNGNLVGIITKSDIISFIAT